MSETTRLKWLFACLYFVQGGTISYFSIFQKPYLNQIGIERGTIGILTSILLLPFILKIGFGWMSDKFPHKKWGHRKPYMLIGHLWGVFWGFQEDCFLTLAMRVVSHGASAFGFALLMALGSLCTATSEAVLTGLTKSMGFTTVFNAVALFILIPILLLFLVQKRLHHLGESQQSITSA